MNNSLPTFYNILSPPQRSESYENRIGQIEAMIRFSDSHRYKKRGKIVEDLQINLNSSNSPFTLAYQKQSFLKFNFEKTEKDFFYGGHLCFSYSQR